MNFSNNSRSDFVWLFVERKITIYQNYPCGIKGSNKWSTMLRGMGGSRPRAYSLYTWSLKRTCSLRFTKIHVYTYSTPRWEAESFPSTGTARAISSKFIRGEFTTCCALILPERDWCYRNYGNFAGGESLLYSSIAAGSSASEGMRHTVRAVI